MAKSSARFIVWGGVALLGLLLVVALVALSQKNAAVENLEDTIRDLNSKKEELRRESVRAKRLREDYQGEQRRRADIEAQNEAISREARRDAAGREAAEADGERWRHMAHKDKDFKDLRDLDKLSQQELEAKMEAESAQLWADIEAAQADGDDEKLAAKLEELERRGKELKQRFATMKEEIDADDEEDEDEAIEAFEEDAEELEQLAEELERDAKQHPDNWKDPKVAARIAEELHDLDLEAEAFDEDLDEEHLAEDEEALNEIEAHARDMKGDAFADDTLSEAEKLQELERRLLKEVEDGDLDGELDVEGELEEEVEEAEARLQAEEAQYLAEEGVSEEELGRRRALDKEYRAELKRLEEEVEDMEGDQERRKIREDENDGASAGSRLQDQASFKKLAHAQDVIDAEAVLKRLEKELMEELHAAHPNEKLVDQLAAEIEAHAEELEEDAERLWDEANAADIDDVDERLMDKQIAEEIERAARAFERDVGIEDLDLHQRKVREGGHAVNAAAAQVIDRDSLKMQHAKGFKSGAAKVESDALDVERELGERDEEGQKIALDALTKDEEEFLKEAEAFEEEAKNNHDLADAFRDEDVKLAEQARADAIALEKEAQLIREKLQASHKARVEQLKKRLEREQKVVLE